MKINKAARCHLVYWPTNTLFESGKANQLCKICFIRSANYSTTWLSSHPTDVVHQNTCTEELFRLDEQHEASRRSRATTTTGMTII